MSKRRKVLVILGLLALAVVCFVALWPVDEPKYQGRYLSEWMARYDRNDDDRASPEFVEAQNAVQTIGTNALPHFLKWMRYKPSPWRESLFGKLPSWIADNSNVRVWIYGDAIQLSRYGNLGIVILGTNAVSAIPELEAMLKNPSKPFFTSRTIAARSAIGEQAIPVLQDALADPNQINRVAILHFMGLMASDIGTNKCLPVFVAALTNDDPLVRQKATNMVSRIAPKFVTNAPAP